MPPQVGENSNCVNPRTGIPAETEPNFTPSIHQLNVCAFKSSSTSTLCQTPRTTGTKTVGRTQQLLVGAKLLHQTNSYGPPGEPYISNMAALAVVLSAMMNAILLTFDASPCHGLLGFHQKPVYNCLTPGSAWKMVPGAVPDCMPIG